MSSLRPLALLLASVLLGCFGPKPLPEPRAPAAAPVVAAPHEASPNTSRPPTARELVTIQTLMRETERIRGLRFLRPVDVRIQNPKAMRAYVSSALEADELERTRLRYISLGLLAPDLDVRTLIESLMEEELVGYYDPHEQRLAIRDDVAQAFASAHVEDADLEWRATVVHELVHALQDQHLGLAAALDQTRTTDADNAFGALVEGDATLAMLAYASGLSGVGLDSLVSDRQELSSTLHGAPESLTGAMRAAPAIVRDPLLFRYREGAMFAATLAKAGGFRAVDAAHRTPPTSTREIIDPSQYLAHKAPVDIALPGLTLLEQNGHSVIDEDSLGRFELGIYLGVGGQTLASPWVADRYAVFRHEDRLGSMWVIQFAQQSAAKRAESASRHGHAPIGTTIERASQYLLLMRGVAKDVEPQLTAEFRAWATAR